MFVLKAKLKYISECFKLRGHDFPTHHSVKRAGEVMVLVLCTSPDGALYLYQASKVSKSFRVIERTRFVTDRQTDIQTHKRTTMGKTTCLPDLDNIIIQ